VIELRVRTTIPEEEMAEKVGKMLTPEDINVVLTRDAKVRKPDGKLLCIYLRQALPAALTDEVYPTLSAIRTPTTNRGLASGMARVGRHEGGRTHTKPVMSSIIGAMDPMGPQTYCRLTAYTAKEVGGWEKLRPYFRAIAELFAEHVPDRYAAQMTFVNGTQPEWVIPGTPFTTITVNNTWATGVHTDKGDLDEGFSCLAVLRRGEYDGGTLCFPQYRLGVNLGDRDLILMDAHEWHGNIPLVKRSDDAERISTVCYYRTRMKDCGSLSEEESKRLAVSESRMASIGE
jgi:hypothetical protein